MTKFPPYPFTLQNTTVPGAAEIGQSQAQKAPSNQFCYYTEHANMFGNVDIDIARDQKMETPETGPRGFDMLAAFNRCVWFKSEEL